MRTLVAGWFSFTGMNVTAGDVMARDVACRWLHEAGLPFDVANADVTLGESPTKMAAVDQWDGMSVKHLPRQEIEMQLARGVRRGL